jgi:hypothetical protein
MAGGGIEGGQIYGSSDATGSEPKDNPISLEKIVSTIANTRSGESSGQTSPRLLEEAQKKAD